MRGTSALRIAHSAPLAGPSKRGSMLPKGKASIDTLRSLVNLHHNTSSFMRDPSEIHTAFQSAHVHWKTEYISYEQFRARALKLQADKGQYGLERLSERGMGGTGARGALGDYTAPGDQATVHRNIFAPPRSWGSRRRGGEMSEREMQVKEALFGTWERGPDGKPRPSLDGMLDVLEAKDTTITEAAKVWKRQEIDETSTEDGM